MEWISVQDRLPPKNTDVLTFDTDKIIVIDTFASFLESEIKKGFIFSDGGGEVTHWMPLPEFPNHSIDKSLYLHKHFQFPKGNKLEWGQDFCMYSCDVPHDVIFQLTEIHDNDSVTLRGYGYGMIDRNDLEASYGCGAISMKLKDILPYEVKQKGV